ncbi:sodium/calcium exchanger 3 precursor, putative [Pediculus humanus corporis]|mgnify:CR=1 FL=1|uniref:Sodium/calcium exchanger 3, putative n=1 Tax=Pediculus humanus subsp. corporis TaxID=121224 RepID=E0VS17_PEDHC|nr:sodium/calcium exchanger 3 precursor, putative [Pediculus humanus corporis]EEB16173.1 sodium/calcium exchanger 3 precursor, putative [Pediculus humanus corporis]
MAVRTTCMVLAGPIIMGLGVEAKYEVDNSTLCTPGLILPTWEPQIPLSGGERLARGVVYLLAMFYLFIGVSIVSDRFMSGIEMITSQEKTVKIKKKNGELQDVKVRVWNETVANLTLMALGSSAPEILLSIIEIIAKDFKAGELGPGTIVGSAAYNLFIIIALCVAVIPDGQTRKIKQLRVFFITAAWSIFAYIWLLLILRVFSEGVVEVWEGLLTFLFFPATVLTSYIADRRLFVFKYLPRISKDKEGEVELGSAESHIDLSTKKNSSDGIDDLAENFEQKCREYTAIYQELKKMYPDEDLEALEMRAEKEILKRGPKSRAFYRMQATRRIVGGPDTTMRKLSHLSKSEEKEVSNDSEEDLTVQKVFFEKSQYKFMEDVGTAVIKVVRRGGNLNQRISVDYASEDGTAEAGSDYEPVSGTLIFNPGETELPIKVKIIDDDEFEEDETFIIRLSNLQVVDDVMRKTSGPKSRGSRGSITSIKFQWQVQLGVPSFVTVTILDDDHGGIFRFGEKEHSVSESAGFFNLKIFRYVGAKGKVSLPFYTEDGTAVNGKEYEETKGEIIFENKEIE